MNVNAYARCKWTTAEDAIILREYKKDCHNYCVNTRKYLPHRTLPSISQRWGRYLKPRNHFGLQDSNALKLAAPSASLAQQSAQSSSIYTPQTSAISQVITVTGNNRFPLQYPVQLSMDTENTSVLRHLEDCGLSLESLINHL